MRLQPADEVHVFHYRQDRVTTERPEHVAPDEQRLIAIGQTEHRDTHAHTGRDRSSREARRIEGESKAAGCSGVRLGRINGVPPRGRQARVGMKKDDPVPRRRSGRRIHLRGAAARRDDPDHGWIGRTQRRQLYVVFRRRGDENLRVVKIVTGERTRECAGIVINGNDDGNAGNGDAMILRRLEAAGHACGHTPQT
jgi:hypothetical protein